MNEKEFIPYFRLETTQNEIDAVVDVLKSGWLTTASKCMEFEKQFCQFLGCKYSLAFNSATAGLHVALAGLDIKKGDKIIVPSYSFVASAEVIHYMGAIPVFCDIEKDTYHLDVNEVEKILENDKKKEIKALMYVSLGGYNHNEHKILQLCKKYNIYSVYDGAHSVPAKDQVGFHGCNYDVFVYSFYANKNMTTGGEGGMAFTNNEELFKKMKPYRLHGISRDVWDRFTSKSTLTYRYDVICDGFKYNLTDIAATFGIEQLKTINQNMQKRKDIARKYGDSFKDIEQISLPIGWEHSKTDDSHSFHLFAIRINQDKLNCSRDEFMSYITENFKIGLSMHFIPIHTFTNYKNKYGFKDESYPVTYDESMRSLSLPIFPSMSEVEIDRVIEAVIQTCKKYKR